MNLLKQKYKHMNQMTMHRMNRMANQQRKREPTHND